MCRQDKLNFSNVREVLTSIFKHLFSQAPPCKIGRGNVEGKVCNLYANLGCYVLFPVCKNTIGSSFKKENTKLGVD